MSATVPNVDARDAQLRSEIDRSLRHPVMFFFTSGALWLFVGVLLGLASSIRNHSPEFLGDAGWLTTGRLSLAHQNILLYGWACQAAFGGIIWLMARLCRKVNQSSVMILVAGHIWNVAVTLGLIGILGGYSTGISWLAFPAYLWPVFLLSYILITVWSVVQFQTREGNATYISQWYLLAAIFAFPWLFTTANLFVFVFDGHPLMKTAVSEWYRGTLLLLFFMPVAIAAAYYLAPKVTGRPVYSYHLALFGFWALMVVAPWAGMQKLMGAPIPRWLPYTGAAATILFLIPALAVGVNVLRTMFADDESRKLTQASPSLTFTAIGMVGLILTGIAGLILNTSTNLQSTQFSLAGYGYDLLALYGAFSMCLFALIYFVVPRVTMREWLSRRFIKWHFLLSAYGVATIVISSLFGGFMQGVAQNAFDKPWSDAATRSVAYSWGISLTWFCILIANVIFLMHLLLMWARLGRRSNHPTLIEAKHHDKPVHGPEGDLEALQATSA